MILEKVYRKQVMPMLEKGPMSIAVKIPLLNTAIYSVIRKKLLDAFGGNVDIFIVGGAPMNQAQKVDEGVIALSPAVELSYLSEEQQKILLDAMSLNDCTPSHAQSIRMKKSAQQGTLSSDSIYEIMSEEKANQTEHISFKVQDLRSFFPKNYTQKQMTETILKLLYDYHRKIERKRNSRDER